MNFYTGLLVSPPPRSRCRTSPAFQKVPRYPSPVSIHSLPPPTPHPQGATAICFVCCRTSLNCCPAAPACRVRFLLLIVMFARFVRHREDLSFPIYNTGSEGEMGRGTAQCWARWRSAGSAREVTQRGTGRRTGVCARSLCHPRRSVWRAENFDVLRGLLMLRLWE